MLLIALRAASLAACLSTFGGVLFTVLILRPPTLPASMYRLILISAGLGVVMTIGWLLVQADVMADADSLAEALPAVPVVAFDTGFGHVILIRLGLLLATILLLMFRTLLPALLTSAVAVVVQTGIAHATARLATDGPALLISEIPHLLAAGAWLGALIPLAVSVASMPAPASSRLLNAFSPFGLTCVLIIAGTGLVQAGELVGGFAHLIDSEYGQLALVKLTIFITLLVVACLNRFALPGRRRLLLVSLSVEILLGCFVILAAASLASSAPSAQ